MDWLHILHFKLLFEILDHVRETCVLHNVLHDVHVLASVLSQRLIIIGIAKASTFYIHDVLCVPVHFEHVTKALVEDMCMWHVPQI